MKTPSGIGISGATVEAQYWNGSTWVTDTAIYGRTNTRVAVYTAGNTMENDEINEGGYVINQLTPGRRYRLKVTNGGVIRYFNVNNDLTVTPGKYTQDVTWS